MFVFVHVVVVVVYLSEAEQQAQNDEQDQKDLDQKELEQDKLIFQLEGDSWRVRSTAHHSPGKHNTQWSQVYLFIFLSCAGLPQRAAVDDLPEGVARQRNKDPAAARLPGPVHPAQRARPPQEHHHGAAARDR